MTTREDNLLDDRAQQVAQKVAAQAESFIAQLLLADWLEAVRLPDVTERLAAMKRVDAETQTFLESLKTSDGAGAGGELTPSSSEQTS